MQPVVLKKNIYWIGSIDWNIRDFHGYTTEKGTTYNSYLVKDKKNVIFDTVKKGFGLELIHRIRSLGMKLREIDYLVINHLEPDHSGSLPELVDRIKPQKIFCTTMGKKAMEAHYNCKDWPIETVSSGDEISLGARTVRFLETRMLHWPDSMFSYLVEDEILISSDAFGQHLATSERFDDEVNCDELLSHSAKYYANILLIYSPLVQKLLTKIKEMNLQIKMICPDHGLIWRKNLTKIVRAYDEWSSHKLKNKALVIYASMWNSTEKMAKAFSESLVSSGFSVKLMNLKRYHRSEIMTEVMNSKILIFGSSTLNNGMLPDLVDFLYYMRGLKPRNKIVTAFGSYGWSGEAVVEIINMLKNMKLKVVGEGLRCQYVPTHKVLKECSLLAKELAQVASSLN